MLAKMGVLLLVLVSVATSVTAQSEIIEVTISGPDGTRFQGALHMPSAFNAPIPAVVMVPGTDGVDQRQDFYRPRLLASGIGTLTLDIKSGVFTSRTDRPPVDHFVPVVIEALRTLRERAEIDGTGIGIMGWSFGAAVALRLADGRYSSEFLNRGEDGFAAYAGIYGGCTRRSSVQSVPILVVIGTADTITDLDRCRYFARRYPSATVIFLNDIHHGFDKEGVDRSGGGRVMK